MVEAAPQERVPVDFAPLLEKVAGGGNLTADEAEEAFGAFMDGSATEIQMAGLLMGLRTKGVVPSEVAGGVRALRTAMTPVPSEDPLTIVDTAGTGGGRVTTFNISTSAALVAAGAGVRIAKHGNRSFTSRSGSADVLEALGVRIELTPERMGEILDEEGIVFMFAPLLHPAMRHVSPVRRGLGVATIMNLLGPLTNPAGARRQVMGVADPGLLDLVASALAELGHIRALVVHGEPGMDEISPGGSTRVAELADGRVEVRDVMPEDLGVRAGSLDGLAGGEPGENAELILRILRGEERDVCRTATLLNAAAAIQVADRAASLEEAVGIAEVSLDSGAAIDALERLKAATHR